MSWFEFHCLWLKNRFRQFNRDESGATDVSNVMWIAVGVLILVGVLALVTLFWDSIKEGVSKILGGGKGDELNDIKQN